MGTTTYDANRRIYRESKLKTANQMMIRLLYGALAIGFLMSFWHSTWLQLALVGVPAALVPTYLIRTAPYARTTRVGVGMALMIFAGLFIFESHGVTEFHFAVFVGLAFLLAYRDWVVIVAAAATIAIHHVALAVLQLVGAPVFLYSTTLNPILLTVFHAVFVVLEAGVLIPLAHEGYAEWARMEEMHRITRALAGENKSGVQAGIKVVLESLEGQLTEAETRGSKALSNVRDVELMAKNQAERAEAAAFAVSKTYDLANRLKSGVAQEVQELTCMTNQLAESRNALAVMETHTLAQKDGVQQALTGSKKATDAVFATLQTADAASKRGAAAAEASKAAVSGLDSQVEQVAESVRTLGSRASQIRGILKTIQDVSEQTNLLALNAAIEAARAGTHGAGFAIVADEVRKLAGRTNDAAAEVAMVIQDMNAQIAETLGNVIGSDEHPGLQDATTTAVETLLTEIEDMRKDLDSIKDASNIAATITGDNTEVFRSIESLAAAANKAVNEGRSKIDDLTASVQRFEGLVSDHGVVATETLSEANFLLQSVQEVSALCEETSASSAEVRLSIDETQGFLVSIRENVTAAEAA